MCRPESPTSLRTFAKIGAAGGSLLLPSPSAQLGCGAKGNDMLNQLTQTQKLGVYGFAGGILTIVVILLLLR